MQRCVHIRPCPSPDWYEYLHQGSRLKYSLGFSRSIREYNVQDTTLRRDKACGNLECRCLWNVVSVPSQLSSLTATQRGSLHVLKLKWKSRNESTVVYMFTSLVYRLHFSSLWQNNWQKQLEGRFLWAHSLRIYRSSCRGRMDAGNCTVARATSHILTPWWSRKPSWEQRDHLVGCIPQGLPTMTHFL